MVVVMVNDYEFEELNTREEAIKFAVDGLKEAAPYLVEEGWTEKDFVKYVTGRDSWVDGWFHVYSEKEMKK